MTGIKSAVKRIKSVNQKARVEETANSDPELSESEHEDDDAASDASAIESEDERDSNEDAGSEGSGSEDTKTSTKANPGWADVMQKILNTNKPKKKKTIVLSKAKKLSEVKVKEIEEKVPFEIQNENGERRKETLPKVEKEQDDESAPVKRRRKDVQLGIRVKPSFLDRERERSLQKIATKGVVQLFNVVKQQQMEIDKKLIEAGPLERKREQVLKSIDKQGFLDVLMGGSKNVPVEDSKRSDKSVKDEEEKPDKVWSVLRDDFVMGAKLKDWDKKAPSEEDDDSSATEEMDSD